MTQSDFNELAVDAWAQPAIKEMREHMPEVAALFKRSGTAELLTSGVTPEAMVEAMPPVHPAVKQ